MEGMSLRGVTSNLNHVLYRNPPITGGQVTHTAHPCSMDVVQEFGWVIHVKTPWGYATFNSYVKNLP
jgi:hypothetical protein